jgi:predicted nucleic acid-binding protein
MRKLKPERRIAVLTRRPEKMLPFVSENTVGGAELLLDTCVYIDNLQNRTPPAVDNLLATRLSNHSGIALSELTHLFGRLDPRDARTEAVLGKVRAAISAMPNHRLKRPSVNTLGEAGILAGLVARLAGLDQGREPALLNDAALYLQAIEQGQTLLTRNIREFDWFDQLLPSGRVLFYRAK